MARTRPALSIDRTLTCGAVCAALEALADPARARATARFFKTGPGEYGEGDVFWGIAVPQQRALARQFAAMPLKELSRLLRSEVHEQRLTALLILVRQYERSDVEGQTERFQFYLKHLPYVNNWDLVDSSARQIVGAELLRGCAQGQRGSPQGRELLRRLARSESVWERRVAIIATSAFIEAGEAEETFAISELLLADPHDLIHKAVGWMLREVGKRVDRQKLLGFLKRHAARMPRTALRYAIEHLPATERRAWLTLAAAPESRVPHTAARPRAIGTRRRSLQGSK